MRAETNLLDLQRRFMAALREPIFGSSRERSDLPHRVGNVSAAFVETADDYLLPSATLEPVERLELYHRQYWYRLLDSIAEDFPGLRLLLGDEAFWVLIESYLESVASHSFTLRHLGQNLPDFISEHAGAVPYAVHAEDLARLEYALCLSFETARYPSISPEELQHARMTLQPHVQLLALRTPADVLWQRAVGNQPRGRLRPAARRATRFIAVFRQHFELRVERIPRAAHLILSTLSETGSLEIAMERLSHSGISLRRTEMSQVREWFSKWVSCGWFCATGDLHSTMADRRTL